MTESLLAHYIQDTLSEVLLLNPVRLSLSKNDKINTIYSTPSNRSG